MQGEINIHNHSSVFAYVYRGYIAIGLYGGFAWIVKRVVTKFLNISSRIKFFIKSLIPNWFFMIYYLVPAWYIYYKIIYQGPYNEFEEPSELILIIGIFLFIVNYYLFLKFKNKVNND